MISRGEDLFMRFRFCGRNDRLWSEMLPGGLKFLEFYSADYTRYKIDTLPLEPVSCENFEIGK